MRNHPIVLTTAAILVGSAGTLAPAFATEGATVESDAAVAQQQAEAAGGEAKAAGREARTAGDAANSSDLDAKLAEARARLEAAAHEVAELSAQMSKPLMEKFMLLGEGSPRAVIGVQLDSESGKDGARVQEVSPGGPAAEAGVHVGDVIVAINGTKVKGDGAARQVLHLMRDVAPETKVKVRVLREGKSREFVVTARPGMRYMGMHEFPRPPAPPGFATQDFMYGPTIMIHGPIGEMELATLTPQLGRYFGTEKGVLVVRAPKDDGFKLEDGDVILSIDGREPTSGSHATRILSSYQPGEKIAIKVMRQHKAVSVETTLPERHGLEPGSPSDRKVRMIRKERNATT